MAVQPANLVAYGLTNALQTVFPVPIRSLRAPTTADKAQIGTVWVYTTNNVFYVLTSIVNNLANWVLVPVSGGPGVFSSLTVTPGPISLTGTTTINTTGTATTTIGNSTSTTAMVGTVNINVTGAGTTTIGTGGTGSVSIGNATGNSTVTGTLTVSSNFFTTNGSVSAGTTTASAASNNIQFLKSRSGGVITTGDTLGNLLFAGYDGTQYTTGASIISQSSGTIASTRVAANLQFLTHPDSAAASPSVRAFIAAAGNVVINAPDSGVALTINGGGQTITAGSLTLTAGNVVFSSATAGVTFLGGSMVISGTGAPSAGLATQAGIFYINYGPTGATDRLFVSTAASTWTNVTCAA